MNPIASDLFKRFLFLSFLIFPCIQMSTFHYGSIQPKSTLLKTPLTKEEQEILQADRPGYGTRNKLEVAFNLVNATVGAGIIGLPFAISQAGFFTGLVASMIVAILAQMGLYMLILSGQRVGIYKFAMLVEYILGRPGYHFLNFIICIQAGGGCVSYFIREFLLVFILNY